MREEEEIDGRRDQVRRGRNRNAFKAAIFCSFLFFLPRNISIPVGGSRRGWPFYELSFSLRLFYGVRTARTSYGAHNCQILPPFMGRQSLVDQLSAISRRLFNRTASSTLLGDRARAFQAGRGRSSSFDYIPRDNSVGRLASISLSLGDHDCASIRVQIHAPPLVIVRSNTFFIANNFVASIESISAPNFGLCLNLYKYIFEGRLILN